MEGGPLRPLAVIDETARDCLATEVASSFTSQDMLGILQYFFAIGGTPHHIRSRPTLRIGTRGPEFVAQTVCR